ncbi:MAG: prolyl oligopeptidase family serine peptidase [Acidobacteriota bacterium]|nr:prolyl oligopeptidase family serine peptidase [Acidobacteriota bacterium]
MKKLGFLLCLIAFSSVFCAAQRQSVKSIESNTFEARIYEKDGKRMPYRLFVPAHYDKNKKYPLVLWLHGGAGRGGDNEKQISGGNAPGATVWTTRESQARNPAFVLAPQCPPGESWSAINDAERKPSKHLETVVELLRDLRKEYGGIDADRLYVAGQSLGGYGAWALITEYPEMFAAAIPLCGGGNAAKAKNLVNVSIWAFHGDEDKAVDVKESRKMIEAVRKAGGNPKYTEYKGVGHAVWERAFAEPELLPWVFAQKRRSGK